MTFFYDENAEDFLRENAGGRIATDEELRQREIDRFFENVYDILVEAPLEYITEDFWGSPEMYVLAGIGLVLLNHYLRKKKF